MARPKDRYKRRCVECWSETPQVYREATHRIIQCEKHYKRWRRTLPQCRQDGCGVRLEPKDPKNPKRGSKDGRQGYCRWHDHLLLKEPHRTAEAVEKTRNKFVSDIVGDPINGCWVWAGRLTISQKYGLISVGNHDWLVHRYSYGSFMGGHKPGHTLDHVCRNPLCVRPDHLMPMTLLSNTRKEHDGKEWTRDEIARALLLIPEMSMNVSMWAMMKGLPIGRATPGEPFGFGVDGQSFNHYPGPAAYPTVLGLARA
jgi:hypothetical protein